MKARALRSRVVREEHKRDRAVDEEHKRSVAVKEKHKRGRCEEEEDYKARHGGGGHRHESRVANTSSWPCSVCFPLLIGVLQAEEDSGNSGKHGRFYSCM